MSRTTDLFSTFRPPHGITLYGGATHHEGLTVAETPRPPEPVRQRCDGARIEAPPTLANRATQNNCFMNAAIQVLYNTDLFRRCLRYLARDYDHHCGRTCQLSCRRACIFCELAQLFDSLKGDSGHRQPHNPDQLREALARVSGFKVQQMNDSVECFEEILYSLHTHLSHSHDAAACAHEKCLPHRHFTLHTHEQKVCQCGFPNDVGRQHRDLMERAYVTPLLRAASRNQHASFGELLRISQSALDPPEVCRGPKCGRFVHKRRHLVTRPDVIVLTLTFPSVLPDPAVVRDTVQLLETTINPAELYNTTNDPSWSEDYHLFGVISYHGHHYTAICYHSLTRQWNSISDTVVRPIGQHWSQVQEYLSSAPHVPTLLLYCRPAARHLGQQRDDVAEPIYADRQQLRSMMTGMSSYESADSSSVSSQQDSAYGGSKTSSQSSGCEQDSPDAGVSSAAALSGSRSTLTGGTGSLTDSLRRGNSEDVQAAATAQRNHATQQLRHLDQLPASLVSLAPHQGEELCVQAVELCHKLLALNHLTYSLWTEVKRRLNWFQDYASHLHSQRVVVTQQSARQPVVRQGRVRSQSSSKIIEQEPADLSEQQFLRQQARLRASPLPQSDQERARYTAQPTSQPPLYEPVTKQVQIPVMRNSVSEGRLLGKANLPPQVGGPVQSTDSRTTQVLLPPRKQLVLEPPPQSPASVTSGGSGGSERRARTVRQVKRTVPVSEIHSSLPDIHKLCVDEQQTSTHHVQQQRVTVTHDTTRVSNGYASLPRRQPAANTTQTVDNSKSFNSLRRKSSLRRPTLRSSSTSRSATKKSVHFSDELCFVAPSPTEEQFDYHGYVKTLQDNTEKVVYATSSRESEKFYSREFNVEVRDEDSDGSETSSVDSALGGSDSCQLCRRHRRLAADANYCVKCADYLSRYAKPPI